MLVGECTTIESSANPFLLLHFNFAIDELVFLLGTYVFRLINNTHDKRTHYTRTDIVMRLGM